MLQRLCVRVRMCVCVSNNRNISDTELVNRYMIRNIIDNKKKYWDKFNSKFALETCSYCTLIY